MIKRWIFSLALAFFIVSNGMAQLAGYYNGTEGKTGLELKTALHGIIKNHVDFSYSDAKYILNYADSDPTNESNIICIYTRRSQPNTSWGSGGDFLNREHVWAKSHGNFVDIRPMDGDAFNLHPADASVNITRSNYDFDECSSLPGATNIAEALAYYTSTQFEPQDAAKGEVARTLFYMAVRYEGTDGELNLEMIDQVGNYPNPKFGKLSTLLQWNNDFPPTANERRRNERVYEAQRNRNPFIDHPEYANMIWASLVAPKVSIGNMEMTPLFPTNTESASISANISTTAGSITSATLSYGSTFNSETNSVVMTENGGVWTGNIDLTLFPSNTYIYYKISASDGTNSNSIHGNYRLPETKTITPNETVQGSGVASTLTGTIVTVSGIVTANLDNTFYLQTSDNPRAGMCVFDIRRGRLGDSIVVTGNVSEYNNLTEIDAVSYIYNYGPKAKATPKVLTVSQVNEDYEGMLVTIKNASFALGGSVIPLTAAANLSFSDATGTMIVYSRYNSRISGKTLPEGNVDVTGVISQYAGTYQLLVNDISDIKMVGDEVAPLITGLTISDNIYIEISFNEKIDKVSLETISNYTFNNGLQITAAYQYGVTKVLLLVSGMKISDYTLTINGVKDLQGNTMSNVTYNFHSDFEDPAYKTIVCTNDNIETVDQSDLNINVLSNDDLPTEYTISIKKPAKYGTVILENDNSVSYTTLKGGAPVLKDTIVYEVCNTLDPEACGEASVFISIEYSKLIICNDDYVEYPEGFPVSINVIENDTLPDIFTMKITKNPTEGEAFLEEDYNIRYLPPMSVKKNELNEQRIINDTIEYTICYPNAPEICLNAKVYIIMDIASGIADIKTEKLLLYPIPVTEILFVKSEKAVAMLEILDISGKCHVKINPDKSDFSVPMAGLKGTYFIRLSMETGEVVIKKVVKL